MGKEITYTIIWKYKSDRAFQKALEKLIEIYLQKENNGLFLLRD
jgi:hypothetical protein